MGFISVVVQRDSSGAPTFSDDEESLLHSQPHTRLFVSSSNRLVGEGVLLITTKRVVWLAEVPAAADDANGYAVGYHSLLMHAISTDTEHFANPSIYCQLEQPEEDEGEEEEEDEEEGEADDTSANTPLGDAVLRAGEARFVPDDPAAGRSRLLPPRLTPPHCSGCARSDLLCAADLSACSGAAVRQDERRSGAEPG